MARHEHNNIHVILRVGWRHKRVFLLSAALVTTACLIAAPAIPVKYTGTAKFTRRVDPASEHMTGAKSESFASRKLTLRNDLIGRAAVERVVEQFGLTQSFPRTEDGLLTGEGEIAKRNLVERVQKQLSVQWEVQSDQVDLVAVNFTSGDSKLAQEIPNAIVHNYISWVSAQIVDNLKGSKDFLEKQVTLCRDRLDAANAELLKFESDNAGMLPESPHVLQEQITLINADLDTLRRQKTLARKQVDQLNELKAASTQPATQPVQWIKGRNPRLVQLEKELREARDELDSMLKVQRMTPAHPTVQAQKRRIEQLEEQVKTTEAEVVTETVYGKPEKSMDLEVQMASARASLEMTTNEIERLESRLQRLNDLQANFAPIRQKYDKMVRNITDCRNELLQWQKRYSEVEMALAAESAKRRTHHDTVQAAQPQHLPSSPSLGMVLAGVVAAGLAAATGVVFLLHKTDQSIRTVEEAESHFDVPVHGAIGQIPTPAARMRKFLSGIIVWPIVWTVVLACLLVVTLNVVLWLRFPDKHQRWEQSPVNFIREVASGQWNEPSAPSGGP